MTSWYIPALKIVSEPSIAGELFDTGVLSLATNAAGTSLPVSKSSSEPSSYVKSPESSDAKSSQAVETRTLKSVAQTITVPALPKGSSPFIGGVVVRKFLVTRTSVKSFRSTFSVSVPSCLATC